MSGPPLVAAGSHYERAWGTRIMTCSGPIPRKLNVATEARACLGLSMPD